MYVDSYSANLINFLIYHPRPLHKISSLSIYNFLTNVANRQINKRYRKHNLLAGDNKCEIMYTITSNMYCKITLTFKVLNF